MIKEPKMLLSKIRQRRIFQFSCNNYLTQQTSRLTTKAATNMPSKNLDDNKKAIKKINKYINIISHAKVLE